MTPEEIMLQDPEAMQAMAAGVSMGLFLVGILFYVIFSLCLMKIAQKTQTPNAWMAWIPLANIFLLFMIAGRPLWWFVLFLVPIVNIVISIIVWMDIATKRGKPSWVGVLMLVPFVNFLVPLYLAFSE